MSDIEIARAATAKPIGEIAAQIGIPDESLMPYGRTKAKIDPEYIASLQDKPDGKLILVTAITPTPAGEGKTTTSVGLHDGLCRIGKNSIVALREPSLGPCFGMKGGAAGGGHAQVIPMEDINLHFTGDFHAIGAAHNLLSALIDNHIYWGNAAGLDSRRLAPRGRHERPCPAQHCQFARWPGQRLPGVRLRRYHDHAGLTASTGCRQDSYRRCRPDTGLVLTRG